MAYLLIDASEMQGDTVKELVRFSAFLCMFCYRLQLLMAAFRAPYSSKRT